MNFLKKTKHILSSRIGIDRAIAFTLSGKIVQAVGSLVTLSLIALFLTKEEQGFYYTFGSILAIQIFFELGLNSIITQYAAHEKAFISGYEPSEIQAEQKAQSRLSSLLHFFIKWFLILNVFLFLILLIAGYLFFTKYGYGENVNWKFPWFILVINTCLYFALSPVLSFLEGLGRVKEIAKLRFIQQIVNLAILWSMLSMGGRLFSAPVAGLCSLIVIILILLFSEFKQILVKIWNFSGNWKVNFKDEIFPYQWKIALSWVSGYFIFQLFNPVLFAVEGAVVAGQMGMTMAVLNGISGLTMSWINTKVPLFSSLIATKVFHSLDTVFNKTVHQLSVINLLLLGAFIAFLIGLDYFNISLITRFLPMLPVVLLCTVTFVNQFIFSWATYLRCHKKEPYLIYSIVSGILCLLSTLCFGKYYGLMGIVIGYSFITIIIGFPWAFFIFKTKKIEWHNNLV